MSNQPTFTSMALRISKLERELARMQDEATTDTTTDTTFKENDMSNTTTDALNEVIALRLETVIDNNELRARCNVLETETQYMLAEKKKLQNRCNVLERRGHVLENRCEVLEDDARHFDDNKKKLQRRGDGLEIRCNVLEEKVEALIDRMRDFDEQVESFNDQLEHWGTRIVEIDDDLESLEQRVEPSEPQRRELVVPPDQSRLEAQLTIAEAAKLSMTVPEDEDRGMQGCRAGGYNVPTDRIGREASSLSLNDHIRREVGFHVPAEHILTADGTKLSVQAGLGLYSTPSANGYAGMYTTVEVGFPTKTPPESWNTYQIDKDVWGYVPIDMVRDWINELGGVVSPSNWGEAGV